MRNADLTDSRPGDLTSGPHTPGEHWRPLAQHLAARFAGAGGNDEAMTQAAITAILEAEHRLGSQRPDLSPLVVPLVVRALRRHRRELIRRRPASAQPLPALQLAIMAAESELSRRLRRSPTVAEVGAHLDMAQHQIVTGLEAGWSGGGAENRL
ncbi:hypothetical protein [Actinoplanes palleronii]|uniref:Uncharacterized protein n=1 Tax=Actinoplanes palleronii TaxID=113570 RepID=A0ABQ4B8S9_9ACTN|nr:hypothetical protein [Actinoplanes palleronii]GIE67028.1 hypothetical protein Apa02nite_031360 [Actinoplanes palleronii]